MLNELGWDYLIPFKLSITEEIERAGIGVSAKVRKYEIQSKSTVRSWLRKFSNFDLRNKTNKAIKRIKQNSFVKE